MILICIIALIILIAAVIFIIEYTFKNSIMSERKSEEKAIEVLKNRKLYDDDLKKVLYESNYEEIDCISNDGLKLKGYYYEKHKRGDKGVILVHGYTANHIIQSPFIQLFLDEGFNVLLIDMRSHGNSEGKYATYGRHEKEDLHIWYKILKDRLKENAFIGLHGQSMGAATSLMYGGYQKNLDFIVSDCGYSNGKDLLKYQIHEKAKAPFNPIFYLLNKKVERVCKFNFNEISPIKDIKNLDIPILFVHGTNDITVPFRMSEEMFLSRGKDFDRFLKVSGAGHMVCYAMDKENYKNVLHEFLEQCYKLKKEH
ncbi:MAG: alpha/beta hydrolase [Clostridium sp.]|uniref:alpha/beta hydrolase n=1 Tax=Clostridium sp. TaxID=1506 RepID=UPI003F39EC93